MCDNYRMCLSWRVRCARTEPNTYTTHPPMPSFWHVTMLVVSEYCQHRGDGCKAGACYGADVVLLSLTTKYQATSQPTPSPMCTKFNLPHLILLSKLHYRGKIIIFYFSLVGLYCAVLTKHTAGMQWWFVSKGITGLVVVPNHITLHWLGNMLLLLAVMSLVWICPWPNGKDNPLRHLKQMDKEQGNTCLCCASS